MTADKITITNTGSGMNEALDITEQTASSSGLNQKQAFHLRLLAEEMLSMLRAVTGDFTAEYWLEHEGRKYTLHLQAKSELDYPKRKELLSVSTKPQGIMEKVRGIIEAGLYSFEESLNLQNEYGTGILAYGALGVVDSDMSGTIYSWSMQKYKNEAADDPEAWDELEKSIIANIADEVNVSVRKNSVELVILKQF